MVEEKPPNKFTLKDPPDLRSQFLVELNRRDLAKLAADQQEIDDEIMEARKKLEVLEPDPMHGGRVHAWVAILKRVEPNNPDNLTQTAFFIEPSTGFSFQGDNPNYLGIESVWNTSNYYVWF